MSCLIVVIRVPHYYFRQ